MEKLKKKEGLSRLFEIAGQKKGLLILAGLLSAGSAACMLVPYWAVYEILKELLTHGGNPTASDGAGMMRWGWIAFGGLVGGLILLYAALMSSHVAAFRILYGLRVRLSERVACPFVRAYRQAPVGVSEQHLYGSHQENNGPEYRENRGLHRPYHSGFGQCSGYGGGYAGHLFLIGCMADGGLPGGRGAQPFPPILQLHG